MGVVRFAKIGFGSVYPSQAAHYRHWKNGQIRQTKIMGRHYQQEREPCPKALGYCPRPRDFWGCAIAFLCSEPAITFCRLAVTLWIQMFRYLVRRRARLGFMACKKAPAGYRRDPASVNIQNMIVMQVCIYANILFVTAYKDWFRDMAKEICTIPQTTPQTTIQPGYTLAWLS